ncbi:cupin domain-containing protein [Clostridium aminobutyricum]|uniref:DUF861 domain-containing protein n=1 Tax=Clostridium aminobutyricum TaxID=33953 RepID=A0A939DBJ4_CLOAM|nr:cupin domain-containing protein [Clostridium aminobutyricum]MBN7774577.1 DUF861 domain-containing protein [Clostridium aminobutyricum]
MKQLICSKEVEVAFQMGQTSIVVEENALITPAAKDSAKKYGITFSRSQATPVCESPVITSPAITKAVEHSDQAELIYSLLKSLVGKGLLNSAFEAMLNNEVYEAERAPSGLKIVRGNTVKYKPLEIGNTSGNVFCQEFINQNDKSAMMAGFITMESGSTLDLEWPREETVYLIEGALTVAVDQTTYTAQQGDTVFFPKGAKVTLSSKEQMKAFYATNESTIQR